MITTVAGTEFVFPSGSILATEAPLGRISKIVVDSQGAAFLSDVDNHLVLRVGADGNLSTYAGIGIPGHSGDGGQALDAMIQAPGGLAVDSAGNLYIADTRNHRVRKVRPDGVITTIAGTGAPGSAGDGGLAVRAQLNLPRAVAVDRAGVVYIADTGNHKIRALMADGTLQTVAGSGTAASTGDGGAATAAGLLSPLDLAITDDSTLLVTDDSGIRAFRLGGTISTRIRRQGIASLVVDRKGVLYVSVPDIGAILSFNTDGSEAGRTEKLDSPTALAVDLKGAVLYAERNGLRVRRLDGSNSTTFAGRGQTRFSGDGGRATAAALNGPLAVASDSAGNLYIADTTNRRIRFVTSKGGISTVLASDSALYTGVAVDAEGNVYVADANANAIVRIRPGSEEVQPVAGSFLLPSGLAINGRMLYVADTGNHQVVSIDLGSGSRTVVAGTGRVGLGGDGGPAIRAQLRSPQAVAIDSNGSLYIADTGNHRIRRVDLSGTISTVAGSTAGFSGDGGRAESAQLDSPLGVAVDARGNVYIADTQNNRIRVRSADGVLTTLAGQNEAGSTGDGGLSTAARLNQPGGLALDAAGNLLIADTGSNRIRAVLAQAPTYTVSTTSVQFQAKADGHRPAPQTVTLLGSISSLMYEVRTVYQNGNGWLRTNPARAGSLPSVLELIADPTGLTPGVYRATVTISIPVALQPTTEIAVTLTAEPGERPVLGVQPASLTFVTLRNSPAQTSPVILYNQTSGQSTFSAMIRYAGAEGWLSLSATNGVASPSAPFNFQVTASPGSLAAGTYSAEVVFTSPGASEIRLPVTMTVSPISQTIRLSEDGLTFTAVAGGGQPLSKSFAVLNLGQGVMQWSASANQPWLSVSPRTGQTDAVSDAIPQVAVAVNTSGMAVGTYTGEVRIASPTALNQFQVVSITLRIVNPGEDPGPTVEPSGIIFTGVAGDANPSSREVVVSVTGKEFLPVTTGQNVEGGNWLLQRPIEGRVGPDAPLRIRLQPEFSGLLPGVLQGRVSLVIGGVSRTITVIALLADPAAKDSAKSISNGCSNSNLVALASQTIQNNFTVAAGQAVSVRVQAATQCNTPFRYGALQMSFSDGSRPVKLEHIGDGIWNATWIPSRPLAEPIRIAITALNLETITNISSGELVIAGRIASTLDQPNIARSGVVNAASNRLGAPLAPGSLVSIYGERLAERLAQPSTLPLPTDLAGTSVILADRSLPLVYTNTGQINAQLPYGVRTDTQLQLQVRRTNGTSTPELLNVSSAAPAIFTVNQSGTGQGVIVNGVTNRIADAANPVRAGDVLVIYCTGLGEVTPAVETGAPAPASPLSRTLQPVSVQIGGQTATPQFSGLTPNFVGLYQVNVTVPAGVAAGDEVPVVVMAGSIASPPVAISVR